MRLRFTSDEGVSVTELLVVTILMGVILAATWTVMYAASAMNNSLTARAVAADEAQVFLDRIGVEMRQADNLKSLSNPPVATSNADAQGAFGSIGDRTVTLYADLYHNGSVQKIEYSVVGTSLVRKEWTATNATYPFTWPGTPNKTATVIHNVDSNWADPIFYFYTNDDLPPTRITSSSQVASITAVMVQVRNRQRWGDRDVSVGTSTTIRVRAIGNGF